MISREAQNRAVLILLGGLILALVAVIYFPALHGAFIWDDDMYVSKNPLLTGPDGLRRIWFSQHFQSQYFPLVYTTLRAEHALWGLNTFGYHLVNVALHGINALLLWTLLQRLKLPGAWLAAAIFAVHPVQLESVAWITELKNTESTLFYFLALLAWVKFIQEDQPPSYLFYALSVVAYLLALFAKTTACTLPAALVLILWLRHARIDSRRVMQITPFVLIGLAMGLLSIWWEGHLGNYAEEIGLSFNPAERLLISSHALWFYAGKIFWPVNLAFSYARWQINDHNAWQYGWAVAALMLLTVLWMKRTTWGRGPIVAVVFFIAALSPMLGFISEYTFRFSFVADHYQYLAAAGLIALFAAIATKAAAHWRLSLALQSVLAAALLATLGSLTWRQAGIYQNLEKLWRDTLQKNPDSWMAHYNLGVWLMEKEKPDDAIAQFRETIKLNPRHAKACINLGNELAKKGRMDEAIESYRQAIAVQPDFALPYFDLGTALANQGKIAEAVDYFRTAANLNPGLRVAWENLIIALSQLGRRDDAFQALRQEVTADPTNLKALFNLAAAYADKGELDPAIDAFQRALKLSPGNASILNNLGNALFTSGKYSEAIAALQQAAQADPKNPGMRFNLAMMLLHEKNTAKARAQLTEALKLKPDFEQARQQLDALDAPPATK